jgi:hypothetical protein
MAAVVEQMVETILDLAVLLVPQVVQPVVVDNQMVLQVAALVQQCHQFGLAQELLEQQVLAVVVDSMLLMVAVVALVRVAVVV